MSDEMAGWDVEEMDAETLDMQRQYIPTEEDLRKVEAERKTTTIKLKDLLNNIADYALKYTNEPTVFSLDRKNQSSNPLKEEAPYELNNAAFVYWCFMDSGIDLIDPDEEHTPQRIKLSSRLTTLYNPGSSINEDSLLRGDLLFFNKDKHVGIYIGDGEFVSMDGPTSKISVGGVHKNKLKDNYWKMIFNGHVKRLTR